MAKRQYQTATEECPSCLYRWVGTWERGVAYRVCSRCGEEFDTHWKDDAREARGAREENEDGM